VPKGNQTKHGVGFFNEPQTWKCTLIGDSGELPMLSQVGLWCSISK